MGFGADEILTAVYRAQLTFHVQPATRDAGALGARLVMPTVAQATGCDDRTRGLSLYVPK
jgi:hypothetical protein